MNVSSTKSEQVMTKVETLVYEYNRCIDCRHCGLNYWQNPEQVWGCELKRKKLDVVKIMKAEIPKWCPLPDKGVKE